MTDTLGKPAGHDQQFSLRSLLLLTTALCLMLALPGGWVLLVTLLSWAALLALIAWPMVAFYGPIYRWIAGRPTAVEINRAALKQ